MPTLPVSPSTTNDEVSIVKSSPLAVPRFISKTPPVSIVSEREARSVVAPKSIDVADVMTLLSNATPST